jgi:hypothetical protein
VALVLERYDLLLRAWAQCSHPSTVSGPDWTKVAACTLALSPYFVTSISRRLQPFGYLHSCSGSFRLEHLPGGAFTHWKTPPFHGAHPKEPLLNGSSRALHYSINMAPSSGAAGDVKHWRRGIIINPAASQRAPELPLQPPNHLGPNPPAVAET